ncbi:GroES-like protein [Paraphaeosphaeria sporulosa]|uniref:GroES-like protein n=1 Tax=Paraphaeosphaeria sporulosa TaxID=1460663 RepID=A0A177CAP0_9PLEO|nr:GroES-like protein [Paraphaeosphaeria sporulosa]OAG04211.1 GroES-like protein [Paraphaeosphaeria sporulosa]
MTEANGTTELPKTCKAGVVVNEGPDFTVAVEDVPVPTPGPNDLLIKLNATGICYSDIHYMLNDLPMGSMSSYGVRSPGHEGAGVVVALGSNVTTWKVGDRAGIKPVYDCCFACELCWSGRESYCDAAPQIGLNFPGSYQQYVLSPARYTQRIPDGVDDFVAGPIMCSGSTIYCSLKEAGLRAGSWAVFPGAGGGVGHMGVQIAKAMGMRVVGIDGGEEKRELCMKLGCEAFVDFTKVEDVAAEVVRICDGKGAHGVFVTASSAPAYASAPGMLRISGKIMCIGIPPIGTAFAGADPLLLIGKNLTFSGTKVGSLLDTARALEFAARGQLKPIYEVFPVAKLPEAVAKLRSGKVAGRLVVDFNA